MHKIMKLKLIAIAILTIFLTAIVGCSKSFERSYTYTVLDDVTYTVKTKRLKRNSEKDVFLFFDLILDNKSNDVLILTDMEIKASLNDLVSEIAHYDSFAAPAPYEMVIDRGKHVHKLYFVFSSSLWGKEIKGFRIVDYGLRKQQN